MKRLLIFMSLLLSMVLAKAADLGYVHAIGDSLTLGAGGDPGDGGYRGSLDRDLSAAGIKHQWVGTLDTWPGGSWPSGRHDGHGGWSTSDLTYGRDGQGCAAQWVAMFQPQTILLMSGRNDDWAWLYSGTGWYQPYTALINSIYAADPEATVYWSNCFMPRDWSYWEDQRCQRQDADLKAVIRDQRMIGRKIFYVDMYRNLHAIPSDYSDAVHLNQSGYNKEEKVWWAVIRKTAGSVGPGQPVHPIGWWQKP